MTRDNDVQSIAAEPDVRMTIYTVGDDPPYWVRYAAYRRAGDSRMLAAFCALPEWMVIGTLKWGIAVCAVAAWSVLFGWWWGHSRG